MSSAALLGFLSRNRQLCQAVALVGLLIAIVVMFLPVNASFSDDPLLRLQGFGRQAGPAPTTAECGSAISNLGTPSGGGTLYEVARDRACRDVSRRRAAIAFAGGLVLVLIGVAGLVRGGQVEAGSSGWNWLQGGRDPATLPPPRHGRTDEGGGVERGRDAPAPKQESGDDARGAGLEGDELADPALPDGADDPKTSSGGGGVTNRE